MADIQGKRRIMQYKDAAKEVGISDTELYNGLRSGRYPGCRVGGPRGRWIVDLDMLESRIQELMENNIKSQEASEAVISYGTLRKIKA